MITLSQYHDSMNLVKTNTRIDKNVITANIHELENVKFIR